MAHNIPALPNVPIVGQACVIKAFTGPQVTVICNCPAKEVLLIAGIGVVTQCPGCKRGRQLVAAHLDIRTGQGELAVADVPVEEKVAV